MIRWRCLVSLTTSWVIFHAQHITFITNLSIVTNHLQIIRRDLAAKTTRVAAGLNLTHKLTITELFDTLCRPTCDGCGKHAPFVNVLTLKHHCYNVRGLCKDASPTADADSHVEKHVDVLSLPIVRSTIQASLRQLATQNTRERAKSEGEAEIWRMRKKDYMDQIEKLAARGPRKRSDDPDEAEVLRRQEMLYYAHRLAARTSSQ